MYLLQNIVYWIHDSDETNPHAQGYIGITNDFDRRMSEHGDKYGLVKEVLHTNLTREHAGLLESYYRPKWYIGKNVSSGGHGGQGGKRGRKIPRTKEHNAKIAASLKGNDNGKYRAIETTVEGIKFRSVKDACDYLSEKYGYCSATAADRIKNNKPFDLVNKGQGEMNPRARTVAVEGKTFPLKKKAIQYLRDKYGLSLNKAAEHIDKQTPIKELLIKRRKLS